ncbi:hypothetical protein AAG906_001221 [Vitis piasezkii]
MAWRSFKRIVEQELGYLPQFVIYAILEWVVIILLFLDGFIGFVANEFAKFFELKTPCLLCTRIDHVLVHRNPSFYYNDSICEDHKKDVSSLAYCHAHRKLSDIRRMCEGCLISFATERGDDCETHRSLVGILHNNVEPFVDNDHKMHVKLPVGQVDKSGVHQCSCCGGPLKMRAPMTKGHVPRSASHGNLLSQAPTPSPRAPFVATRNEDFRHLELPQIRHMDLKFSSDNESELLEDEYSSYASIQGREDVKACTVPLLTESEDSNEERTPMGFSRGNRFFGISLTDSATSSPRWATRLPRKPVLEKAEFVLEPLEGNAANEADSDSTMQRLKRQARLDRKSLIALYMELDEERSASAIAANNAMAMITRLQAEKASVQMEALQYQRMMEEQAEYDQEDLQAMRDLLGKREDEIKALEAELEMYQPKNESSKKFTVEGCDSIEIQGYEDDQQLKSESLSEKSECSSPAFCFNEVENNGEHQHKYDQTRSLQEENGGETIDKSSGDFEGERSNLLNQLKNMKKFHSSAHSGRHSLQLSFDMVNDTEEGTGNDTGDACNDIISREVPHLHEKLKALEEDGGFLNHAARALEKGSEGRNILTQIAHHLHKLQDLVKIPLEDDCE